jgi:hypothetical protein
VAGSLLDVSEGDAGVEGGGDERVANRVGPDRLVDARFAGEAPHDAPGGVPFQALAVLPEQDRPSTVPR